MTSTEIAKLAADTQTWFAFVRDGGLVRRAQSMDVMRQSLQLGQAYRAAVAVLDPIRDTTPGLVPHESTPTTPDYYTYEA